MGRGKSADNVALISEAHTILEAIHPATVRAVCYQLFTRNVIDSMGKNNTNRVSVQLRDARLAGSIPWEWIVDETREAECINAWRDPTAYIESVRRCYRRDRWADQPAHVEVCGGECHAFNVNRSTVAVDSVRQIHCAHVQATRIPIAHIKHRPRFIGGGTLFGRIVHRRGTPVPVHHPERHAVGVKHRRQRASHRPFLAPTRQRQ